MDTALRPGITTAQEKSRLSRWFSFLNLEKADN